MARQGQVYLEFIHSGNFVKVTAIDAETGIEGTIVGDPKASRELLENLAMKKLQYVINKQNK